MQDNYYNAYGMGDEEEIYDPGMDGANFAPQMGGMPQGGGMQSPFGGGEMNQIQMAGLLLASGMPFDKAMVQSASMQQQRQAQTMQNYKYQLAQQKAMRQQQAVQDFGSYIDGGDPMAGAGNQMGGQPGMQPASMMGSGNPNAATLADMNGQGEAPQQGTQVEPQGGQDNMMTAPAREEATSLSNVPLDVRRRAKMLAQSGDIKGAYDLVGKYQLTTKDAFEMENKLRDEFVTQSKPWHEINSSYTRIKASAANPSPAGDIALIYNYMKMLDPGSVVREGEFATAANAGGIPERIRAQWNKLQNGERLSDGIRSDFLDRAGTLYDSQQKDQNRLEKRYTAIAKRNKLNDQNIVFKYEDTPEEAAAAGGQQTQGASQSKMPVQKTRAIQDLSDAELQAIINGQ